MQPQTSNEVFYKRAVTALGIGTLFFLLFLLLISGAVAALTFFLAVLPFPSVIAKLIYQLTYGALYLAAFLCPIPIMKGLTRARGLPWQAVRTDRGMSRYLPLIVLGGITVILAQSYLNAGLVSFFDFDRLFDSTLPSTDGKMTGLDLLLSLLVMAAVPAFCEEFLFRGAILGNLLLLFAKSIGEAQTACFLFLAGTDLMFLYLIRFVVNGCHFHGRAPGTGLHYSGGCGADCAEPCLWACVPGGENCPSGRGNLFRASFRNGIRSSYASGLCVSCCYFYRPCGKNFPHTHAVCGEISYRFRSHSSYNDLAVCQYFQSLADGHVHDWICRLRSYHLLFFPVL